MRFGAAVFNNVAYSSGVLKAEALGSDGSTVVAVSTKASYDAPAAIQLSLDAPSLLTGTGSSVYLDGGDVALVRATIVDGQGNIVQDASNTVTFSCVSGPCAIAGTGNGQPDSQEPYHSASRPAYHGLVRAVVRASLVAAGSASDRALLATVNVDAGKGAGTSTILVGDDTAAPTAIVLSASSPGLKPAQITIRLSVDPSDAVLAVAERSVAAADIGE